MKNINIHKKLKEAELRDFLGKQPALNESHYTLEAAEKHFKEAQDILERTKNYLAIQTVLKLKGWLNTDCSDEIDDFAEETYFSFVGTAKEFQAHMMQEKK